MITLKPYLNKAEKKNNQNTEVIIKHEPMNLANRDYMGCKKKNVVNFNLLTANIYHAVDISDHHSGDRSWVR